MKLHTISPLLILVTTFVLQSCTSMFAISTAAFITSTTWNDSRTIGTQLDDKILETYITHTLNKNKCIKKNTRIINTVYQGNVLLIGQAPSLHLSKQIEQIVQHIHGTKKVYNAIRQKSPISLLSVLYDIWISSQIRLNLLILQNIHSLNIKIITEDKEVFLIGQTTYEEGKFAEEIAKKTYGVKNVFTVFTYI